MRVYSAVLPNTAVTTAVDLFEITAASTKSVRVVGLFLSQLTEVGDTEEEMLLIEVNRGHTTSGSGGSTVTPTQVSPTAAAGVTIETFNTTLATAGTAEKLHAENWNIRGPFQLFLPDYMQWHLAAGSTGKLIVRSVTTPADSVTIGGTLYFIED